MSQQVRFTASLDADLKKKLEEVADRNFRKLSGELNVAVEFYLKHIQTQVAFVDQVDKVSDVVNKKEESLLDEDVKTIIKPPSEKKNKTKLAPLG